jgi:hypothetical protein
MKINSQEIAHPSVVPRSIFANQRQRVWWTPPTRQNIKNKHDACIFRSVSRDESMRICSRMEEDRTCLSTPNHAMHTSRTYSAHAQRKERLPHTTGVFKFRAQKGNIKGLQSIRIPTLTRQPLYKPQHCQSPSNHKVNSLTREKTIERHKSRQLNSRHRFRICY